jgi:hypothetical protein
LYSAVDASTRSTPSRKYLVGWKSLRKKYEMTEERTMDRAAAKPFKMLSAYLMTAATTNPPSALRERQSKGIY